MSPIDPRPLPPPDPSQRAKLLAYLDGELAGPERAHLEHALAQSADLRHELAEFARVARLIDSLPAPAPTPASLWPAIQEHLGERRRRPPMLRDPRLALGATLAAGMTLGVVVGTWATGPRDDTPPDLALATSLLGLPAGSPSSAFLALTAPGSDNAGAENPGAANADSESGGVR